MLHTVVQYSSTCYEAGFYYHCSRAGNAHNFRLHLSYSYTPSATTNAKRVNIPYSRKKVFGWEYQHSPDTSYGAASIPGDISRHDERVTRSQRKGLGGGDVNEQHIQKYEQLSDKILS